MSGRTIAIGDIHGCSRALRTLVEEIAPSADDNLVFLGDYVDRGSDSRGVIDLIIQLQSQCNVIPLLGNHEVMFIGVVCNGANDTIWKACGGNATLASYGGAIHHIPGAHLNFLRTCRPYWEDAANIFVHASYLPSETMDALTEQHLYWEHLPPIFPLPHVSGKRVIVGHTPQANFEPLDIGHLVCLDTYCFGGGWLTAMDVDSGDIWQANLHGHMRRKFAQRMFRGANTISQAMRRLWRK